MKATLWTILKSALLANFACALIFVPFELIVYQVWGMCEGLGALLVFQFVSQLIISPIVLCYYADVLEFVNKLEIKQLDQKLEIIWRKERIRVEEQKNLDRLLKE